MQGTGSSISNYSLKPAVALITSAKKKTKIKLHTVFQRFLHMSYFSESFSQTSLAHPDFKVLDLNIHVKHIMGPFP